ncbi:PIN domain-containing protein [Archangium sp.]|uniref:PIN domain-containing protein n=1 Tax=Archangium sp. TaxID=1872627 RepID=UPI00389ACE84
MFPAIFRVFLDTNVLFPSALRDTLLRAAETGLVQVYWSADVLLELERNLVRSRRYDAQGAARLIQAMRKAFPSAEVRDYQHLIASMLNHPKDRHVVAAAHVAGAQVIVTNNLADFRTLPEGMEAQDADSFLQGLFDLSPEALVRVLTQQAADKRNPPLTLDQLLEGLARSVPGFIAEVRVWLAEQPLASTPEES